MGNKNIKPCPFCGSPAFSYSAPTSLLSIVRGERIPGYVECASCRAIMPAATEERARELWNRRAQND